MVTAQAPVPVHAPDQPEKAEPAPGAAERFTTELVAMGDVHGPGEAQFTESGKVCGDAVIVPVAPFVPLGRTVRPQVAGGKVAVIERLPVSVTTQFPETTEVQPTQVGASELDPAMA
jgi:hypothetical protein